MGRHSDDEYDGQPPPRRSKSSKYYADDDDVGDRKSSRQRAPYAPDAPSSKGKQSPRDYGDPRDVEPRGSGSERDRRPPKPSRRGTYDSDDDDHGKSSRKEVERPRKKAYDLDDDDIAPLPKGRSHKGKGLDRSDSPPPRKNEGRRRANTLDSDDFDTSGRKDSKRGYDDRRDKRPSRYDDYDDSLAAVKPSRRPKDDDRGYKSHDDARPKRRSAYDDYDDKYTRDRGSGRRDGYADYSRSDRDRDRGYRSMDEGKRRSDNTRSSGRDRDRDRDRDRRGASDRYDSYGSGRYSSDRSGRDRDRGGSGRGGKYGIKLDPDRIRDYYETGQKHYKTFKPIIDSMAKMYLDSKKA